MKQYLKQALMISVLALGTSACNFVTVSDAGAGVTQATAADVQNCTDLGAVVARTQASLLIKRGDTKVRQELIDLARNEAAELGGNAIVAIAPPEQGVQRFRAYRCQ